jgi:hypothetical protein
MGTTKKTNSIFMKDVTSALASLNGWGSVELYVQDGKVTQITSRKITKTQHNIGDINSQ